MAAGVVGGEDSGDMDRHHARNRGRSHQLLLTLRIEPNDAGLRCS